jgi:FixJ family two-component response regulator
MINKLTQRLLTLALIFAVTFLSWEVPVASANHVFNNSSDIEDSISLSENDLTPQEHQALQGIRQRRNREIAAILDLSQRNQLINELHNGNNLDRSLETLNLTSQQRELINSITALTNLKLKGIFSRHSLMDQHKSS